jgi:amino acid adenylation domain-containing protein
VDWGEHQPSAELQYGTEFTSTEAARIARYFERVLKACVADPAVSLASIELLDEDELKYLLEELNQTQAEYPNGRCFHELFEAQVERTPEAAALVFRDRELTFRELNAAANRLARQLCLRGIGAGTRVGLCLDRGPEMIIGLVGILKAGGAYVPLLADHPKARIGQQMAESGAAAIVTQQGLLGRLSEFTGAVVCLDRDAESLAKQPDTNLHNSNTPSDLMYVMYTSGSTGTPKGVAVSHQNVVNYTSFLCRKLGMPDETVKHFALVSSLNADLGYTSIFPPLAGGGCLHVIPYEDSVDGRLWADYVASHRVDVLKITPSHLSALMASAPGRNVLPRRYLISGGEALSWDLVWKLHERGTCQVINHYGPTEVTIGVLTYDVAAGDQVASQSRTVPIGRPIANGEAYVLDRGQRPVPRGVPGEIYLGGAGLSRGYINQPGETALRFVRHPFRPAELLYRSGDRGRVLAGGAIEFLGRSDNQVKIRGFRIELGEIETVLLKHPLVRQAAVIARETQPGEKSLSAFLVLSEAVRAGGLEEYLRDRLPDYMIPARCHVLEKMPLLPNGKIDRQTLAEREQPGPERTFVAPRNAVEQGLAEIFAEVLKRKEIGIYDSFFELGGHSLVATMALSRLCAVFDVHLPLRTIFEAPTIAEMAEIIERIRGENESGEERARMLAELEQLSDEEVRKLLGEMEGSST